MVKGMKEWVCAWSLLCAGEFSIEIVAPLRPIFERDGGGAGLLVGFGVSAGWFGIAGPVIIRYCIGFC